MSQILIEALKARLPFVRVTTDDMMNVEQCLQSIAQTKSAMQIDTNNIPVAVLYKESTVLWTDNEKLVTEANYEILESKERTLVVVNCKPSPLAFDAGQLLPTAGQVSLLVMQYTDKDLTQYLQGMSLIEVDRTLRMASVKFGNLLPSSLRATRAMLGVPIQGLYPVDVPASELYQPDPHLKNWLSDNRTYFLSPNVHHSLRPRGVLLYGEPGTGKSAASRWLARSLGVPLYRLDIATSMNKYIGESEYRLMRILRQLEDHSPCVMLLDEVEKVFVHDQDSGVSSRMMSQLLWWLSEHRSMVLTVMTTNDKQKIPSELFREGRVDCQLEIKRMGSAAATELANSVAKNILGPKLTLKQAQAFAITGQDKWTPAEVIQRTVSVIKIHGWGIDKP